MCKGTLDEHLIEDQPRIDILLPEEPGDDRLGLLPVTAYQAPVRVRFAAWENSLPSLDTPETITFFWGDDEHIDSKVWTAPIAKDDYWVDLDLSNWPHGARQLFYRLQIFNGAVSRSQSLAVYVDRELPRLAGGLELPPELTGGVLTAHYLELNDDTLTIGIPLYSDPRPGDTVTLFWDATLNDDTCIKQWRLAASDLQGPLSLPVDGQAIRDEGDGQRYLHYQITDRAGNESDRSAMLTLDVQAQPIPRALPMPSVEQAQGSGEVQRLQPASAVNGVTVTIPADATIYPEETLWLEWGAPGEPGGFKSEPIAGSQRWTFRVPGTAIGAHLGKTLAVAYKLHNRDGELPSDARRVAVDAAPPSLFSQLRCNEAVNGRLRLSGLPNGATLNLPKWALISTDQWLRIDLSGIDMEGLEQTVIVMAGRAVTTPELATGLVNVPVPRSRFTQLRAGQIVFKVYVRFSSTDPWPREPTFPTLVLQWER